MWDLPGQGLEPVSLAVAGGFLTTVPPGKPDRTCYDELDDKRGPVRKREEFTGSRHAGSVVVAHGPSCSAACGIFPDQGSNLCPLRWQADSQPLRHQGSPLQSILIYSTGSRCAGSVIVAHGPSCSAACGIFPDQGSNPCSLHWQADSQPLCHQGSPGEMFIQREVGLNLHLWNVFYTLG
ncbi:hypothetical protein J1605_021464 [Eschrichtius robustus]|uniref:Uncharacterized protein n=1 Tax=Eschrichtius robustus TaxID=9764 RepID=A0AB34HGY3_ESCRO|nr:hypothetical protein J1605_021464 [Eschrichtius robustus]